MHVLQSRRHMVLWGIVLILALLFPALSEARPRTSRPSTGCLNVRSAILVDTSDGKVLYEQNADTAIPPASVTKIISLFLVFDALRDGRVHLWDNVTISTRAASTGGSRMCLKAGRQVPLEELIKGMAVASGNDACVAVAEYLAGSVEEFVERMNVKARELGLVNTLFTTPNGLPSPGQTTTARDMAKLSLAYLRRFPDSLEVHSMKTYSYQGASHRNANRLLGNCMGVDGIKTGFVCAAGYNISATARRGDVRLLAVVMGAPSPGVRAAETTKLLEAGFQKVAQGTPGVLQAQDFTSVKRTVLAGDTEKSTCSPTVVKARTTASKSAARYIKTPSTTARASMPLPKPTNMKLTSHRNPVHNPALEPNPTKSANTAASPAQATISSSKKTAGTVAATATVKTKTKANAAPAKTDRTAKASQSKDQKLSGSANKPKQPSPALTKKNEPLQKTQPQAQTKPKKG